MKSISDFVTVWIVSSQQVRLRKLLVRSIPLNPIVYETRSYLFDDETTHAVTYSYYRILLELSTGRK